MNRLARWALAAVILAPAAAWAQPKTDKPHKPGASHPGKPSQHDRERLKKEIFDQLRAWRMWRITEELKLDEGTAAKVFPLLARYDEQERDLGRERGETYRELRGAVEAPAPDNARITALVDKLVANRARRTQMDHERFLALRKVLTPVQTAKLVMLLPRLEDGFRQRIKEAMDRHKGDGGGDRGGRSHDGAGAPPRP